MKKRIIIVGGSIAGLTSALILASAKNDSLDFDIDIIDEGKADLKNVAIYNVPFFPKGITYADIIKNTKEQIDSMLKVNYIDCTVEQINGEKGSFSVVAKCLNKDNVYDYVILATGAGYFNISGLGDVVEPHTLMNKPNKIRLKTTGRQMLKEGIYVAGLASGATSMVTAAMGSASEAACAILSDIKGEIVVVHDTPSSRK